jgi:hypothetical protein
MSFAMVRRSCMRILLTLLCTAGFVGSVTAVTQSSAQAATVNCAGTSPSAGVFYVYYGQSSCVVPISHKCMQVGSAAGSETADECADISVNNTGSSVQIWGTGEFYCQGASGKCDEIDVTVGASATDENAGSPVTVHTPSPYVCTSGCPNGSRADVSTAHINAAHDCYWLYSWDPTGEKFIDGTDHSHTSTTELDSNYGPNLQVCLPD